MCLDQASTPHFQATQHPIAPFLDLFLAHGIAFICHRVYVCCIASNFKFQNGRPHVDIGCLVEYLEDLIGGVNVVFVNSVEHVLIETVQTTWNSFKSGLQMAYLVPVVQTFE